MDMNSLYLKRCPEPENTNWYHLPLRKGSQHSLFEIDLPGIFYSSSEMRLSHPWSLFLGK